MSVGIFKAGKGKYGKNQTAVKPEDILLLQVPTSTAELINNGDKGTSKYITNLDLLTNGRGIISGDGIIWVKDWEFKAPKYVFAINGVEYTADARDIILSNAGSTSSDNRRDTIVGTFDVNGNGIFEVLEGVTGLVGVSRVINENTQIFISEIDVDGSTTQPSTLANLVVYDENIEFTTSSTGTANFNATNPSKGTKNIAVTNFTTGQEIAFASAFNPTLYDGLVLDIEPNGVWQNSGTIKLAVYNGATLVSNLITINSDLTGLYTFDSSNPIYQSIIIPKSVWGFIGTSATSLKIIKDDNKGAVSFNLDNIRFQLGITYTPPVIVKTKLSQFINDGDGDIAFPFITVTPNLQSVLNEGNTANVGMNLIINEVDRSSWFIPVPLNWAATFPMQQGFYTESFIPNTYHETSWGGGIGKFSFNVITQASNVSPSKATSFKIYDNGISLSNAYNKNNLIKVTNITADRVWELPDKSGTFALLDDITGATANLQKTVTASTYIILTTDNNYTIFFNSAVAVTVTVNNDLADNFECDFYNLGVGTVTFVAGTATLGTPDGTGLATDKVGALIKVMALNNYKLKGEFV